MGNGVVITGVGVDIISIERFARPLSPRFFTRVFTEGERVYLQGKPPQCTAGLFAAKEAVVKALGTGFAGFWPCEVEVRHEEGGKPCMVLYGKANKILAGRRIHVSISHNETSAVAFAVVEGAF